MELPPPRRRRSSTHKGSVGAKGRDSVGAAITALVRNHTVADLLVDCVNFGGDVDTVAAIAMAAAACADDIVRNIPEALRDSLIELDRDLQEFARRQGQCNRVCGIEKIFVGHQHV
jgi:ADP-ribosyl-[dinitrogen reductase] hydrolase